MSANSNLVRMMIILRPNSPEMFTSVVGLDENSNFVVKAIIRIIGTLVLIWVTIAAERGVILIASLYVATVFWSERSLLSMK